MTAQTLPEAIWLEMSPSAMCFSGSKLMGVNAYAENAGWAVLLAEFLTNEESQVARFNARQLAPANVNAAADPAVEANIAIAASAMQVALRMSSIGGLPFFSSLKKIRPIRARAWA